VCPSKCICAFIRKLEGEEQEKEKKRQEVISVKLKQYCIFCSLLFHTEVSPTGMFGFLLAAK
jgi:hypothetical protein